MDWRKICTGHSDDITECWDGRLFHLTKPESQLQKGVSSADGVGFDRNTGRHGQYDCGGVQMEGRNTDLYIRKEDRKSVV